MYKQQRLGGEGILLPSRYRMICSIIGRFYKLGRVYFVGYFEQISYLFRGRYAGIATEER